MSDMLPNHCRSILQDWVMELPLREQGTLLTCVRGCDLTPKLPLDGTARHLVAFLRFSFMTAADVREVDAAPGCFFRSTPPREWKASELGHFPQHWISHVMHASEVVGWRHPDRRIGGQAWGVYETIVRSLHLHPENFEQFVARLSEDRIESGEIVS